MNNPIQNEIYKTTLASGQHWSFFMRRGFNLTMTDRQGGINVGMLLYNKYLLHEKYNAPDTLKCQHTFTLTRGHCLYSDMGRILCSVIDDQFGGHDTVCGNSDAERVASQWQGRSYQQQGNQWCQNGRDSFLTELAKYGLGARHFAANVNWFSHVVVDDAGNMQLRDKPSKHTAVTLRFEMDSLVVLHTCPHPLDRAEHYPRGELEVILSEAAPVSPTDVCLNHCEENRRGFHNNALYHLEPSHV